MTHVEYICLDCGKHGQAIPDDKHRKPTCAACGSDKLRKLSSAKSGLPDNIRNPDAV